MLDMFNIHAGISNSSLESYLSISLTYLLIGLFGLGDIRFFISLYILDINSVRLMTNVRSSPIHEAFL